MASACKYYPSFSEISQLQLNLGGMVEHFAVNRSTTCVETNRGFRLRTYEKTAFADCNLFTCRGVHEAHSKLSAVSLLYAKVIFPLSSTVVVFADNLGGLALSAKALAGFARVSPIAELQPPPYILVIALNETCTERDFNRMVATELLCLLREEHPETLYSFAEIQQMWARRVFGVCMIRKVAALVFPQVLQLLGDVTHRRENDGFGLSACGFRELLQQAITSITHEPERPFDILRALRIRNPVTPNAKSSLQKFLDRGNGDFSRASIAASCVAFYAYSNGAYVSYAGLVAQSLAGRLLSTNASCNRVLAQMRQYILQMVQRHQSGRESLAAQHFKLLRNLGVSLPGCSICLFNIPIHEFTCGHKFCYHCVLVSSSDPDYSASVPHSSPTACFICDKPNLVSVSQKPSAARGRVLALSGSPGSVLKFLANMRNLLFGHLADYLDLIITSKSAAAVVLDYFCFRSSIPECARNLKESKKVLALCNAPVQIPKTGIFVSVFDGKQLVRNYGDSPKLQHAPQVPYRRPSLAQNRAKEYAKIPPHVVDAESRAIWGPEAWGNVEYDGRDPGAAEAASGWLLAALFYVEACCMSEESSLQMVCELEIKCRLAAGPHLNAVVRALLYDRATLHCSSSRAQHQVQFCDWDIWRAITSSSDAVFSRKIALEVDSMDCSLEFTIETNQLGKSEHVSNSPCRMVDLFNNLPTVLRESKPCKHSSQTNPGPSQETSCTDVYSMSRLDRQVAELEDLLTNWK